MKCILCEENHARRKYCYCFSCEKSRSEVIYNLKLALLRPKEITDTKRNEITSSIEKLIEDKLERERLEQLKKIERQKESEELKHMFNEDTIEQIIYKERMRESSERTSMSNNDILTRCHTCGLRRYVSYVYSYWDSCNRMYCYTDGSCCRDRDLYECDGCKSTRKFCFACDAFHWDNQQCKECLDCKKGHTDITPWCRQCKKKCRIHGIHHNDNNECSPLDHLASLLSKHILIGKYIGLTYREVFNKDKQYIRRLIKKRPEYEDSWWLEVVIDGLIKMAHSASSSQ